MKQNNTKAVTGGLSGSWPIMRETIQENGTTSESEEEDNSPTIYGAVREAKEDNHIRIGVGNVGCWPHEGTVAFEDFKNWATQGDFDALLLSELGRNWSAFPPDQRLESIVRNWWMQTYTNSRWLKIEDDKINDKYQYGGTAVISNDRIACTVHESFL